jgi:hypothetical protein
MKLILLIVSIISSTGVQAQTIFFNDSTGAPLGTANQIGRTTYYNDATGAPLGTANQVGRITYYNDSSGLPLGTSISPQPTQPYYVPQFNNQPIPRVPVAPLYPIRTR